MTPQRTTPTQPHRNSHIYVPPSRPHVSRPVPIPVPVPVVQHPQHPQPAAPVSTPQAARPRRLVGLLDFSLCFLVALLAAAGIFRQVDKRRDDILSPDADDPQAREGLNRMYLYVALLALLQLAMVGPEVTLLLALATSLRLSRRERVKNLSYSVSQPLGRLEALLEADPNFSLPIFREFAVLLYCQAQLQRLSDFSQCRPYLSEAAQATLRERNPEARQVTDVVVGTCQLLESDNLQGSTYLEVSFEANYLQLSTQNQLQAFIANETWTFRRRVGVLTKPPADVAKLVCPSCGFGGEFDSDGRCPQCQNTNEHGQFDWQVESVTVDSLEPFEAYSAEVSGVEVGTDMPTLRPPDFERRTRALVARNQGFSWDEFQVKAIGIFLKVQEAWTSRNWSLVRPHETDVIFRTHRYWIENYLRENRINRLKDIKVTDFMISNIVTDALYESIVVRIFAEMIDYTECAGQVVSGDPATPRTFSEYWTFVRRLGYQRPNGDSLVQCPSCGAPLDRVNPAGFCEYCETLVSTGNFDWVLSYIEQDEVYEIAL